MKQHRFGPMQPPYLQVLSESCLQHLAEHYSGACRSTTMRMVCNGIAGFYAGLAARQYIHAFPGIEHIGCGTREVAVQHSFGNQLAFANAVST